MPRRPTWLEAAAILLLVWLLFHCLVVAVRGGNAANTFAGVKMLPAIPTPPLPEGFEPATAVPVPPPEPPVFPTNGNLAVSIQAPGIYLITIKENGTLVCADSPTNLVWNVCAENWDTNIYGLELVVYDFTPNSRKFFKLLKP